MILIINNHTPYTRNIRAILKKHNVKFIIKDQRSPLADVKKEKISGVILSGGGPNLDMCIDLSLIKADLLSLISFKVPILGICEGHQIIAQVYGGEVLPLKRYFTRETKIKIVKKSKIFKGLPKEIIVEESHGRYVKTLPKNFVLSATSEKNKVEAMFHKTKPIFSVQFHPEGTGKQGEKIIENFLKICKEI